MMVLTVHNLAKTYKMLPSQALAQATTFDLYVLDTYSRHVKYQQAVQDGTISERSGKNKVPTQDEMLEMIKKVRSEK